MSIGRLILLVSVAQVLVAAGAVQPVRAGTIRHDRSDASYLALGADPNYASVGSLTIGGMYGSGTLIAVNYVLTAAHVTGGGSGISFNLGGTAYEGAWFEREPNWTGTSAYDWDIAIVRLKDLVLTVAPAVINTSTSELGKVGTIVGYGCTGTGLTGYVLGTEGTKRAGRNMIDATGTLWGYTDRILLSDFDDPNSRFKSSMGANTPLDLEYLAAKGDSGGAVFIDSGGTKLAGVITALSAPKDGNANATYSDAMFMTRVSSFSTWINSVVGTAYEVRWVAGDGNMNTGANWETTRGYTTYSVVPGPVDTAIFEGNGAYTVTWPGANVANDRLAVRQGGVTCNLSGRTYSLKDDSNSSPSVVVGGSGGSAALTISNGTLSSVHAFIGPNSADTASLTVSGTGAAWNNSGSVYVGGGSAGAGGTGVLMIGPGGQVSVGGTVKVWPGGTVSLAGGGLAAGQVVLSGGALEGSGTVSSSVTVNAGAVHVSTGALNLSGQLSIVSGSALTKSGEGTLVVNAPQAHAAGAVLSVDGGEVDLNTDAGGGASQPLYNLTVNVNASSVHFNTTQHLATLNLNHGSATSAPGGGTVLVTRHLSIDPNGAWLDLNDNDLIVDYQAGSSPINDIVDWLRSGLAGGSWTGKGIISTAAAHSPRALTTIAAVDNAQAGYGSFAGHTVDSSTVLVKYTWYGDADLNGSTNTDDFALWTAGFNRDPGTTQTWLYGDFDYNGAVNTDDFALWAFAFDGQSGTLGAGFMAPLPEPATVVLLGLGCLLPFRRRRLAPRSAAITTCRSSGAGVWAGSPSPSVIPAIPPPAGRNL